MTNEQHLEQEWRKKVSELSEARHEIINLKLVIQKIRIDAELALKSETLRTKSLNNILTLTEIKEP